MASSRRLDGLRQARNARHSDLLQLPHVIGTGLGVKRRRDEVVDLAALVVLVDKKVQKYRLSHASKVPAFVVLGGRRIPTDVIEIAGVRSEFGSAPYSTSDRYSKGTLSAFARSGDQRLHGISCAHCLAGADRSSYTPSDVEVWDPAANAYRPAGHSGYAVENPGFGLPGDYGFSDAGLIELEHPSLLQRANAAPELPVLVNPRRGMEVVGQTYAADASGTIDAVETIVGHLRVDLLVRVSGEGTFPGYSGMLWRTRPGHAVGLHAYGAGFDGDAQTGSRYSLAMAARRVVHQLQVRMLDPGWR